MPPPFQPRLRWTQQHHRLVDVVHLPQRRRAPALRPQLPQEEQLDQNLEHAAGRHSPGSVRVRPARGAAPLRPEREPAPGLLSGIRRPLPSSGPS